MLPIVLCQSAQAAESAQVLILLFIVGLSFSHCDPFKSNFNCLFTDFPENRFYGAIRQSVVIIMTGLSGIVEKYSFHFIEVQKIQLS